MKILILKGNAPRHNYFANEIKQLKGFGSKGFSGTKSCQDKGHSNQKKGGEPIIPFD